MINIKRVNCRKFNSIIKLITKKNLPTRLIPQKGDIWPLTKGINENLITSKLTQHNAAFASDCLNNQAIKLIIYINSFPYII